MSSFSPCGGPARAGMQARRALRMRKLTIILAFLVPPPAVAQTMEAITFEEAIRRAVANNPTIQQAAAGILRAEALLQQTRALSLPAVNATLATTTIGPVPEFGG